MIKKPLSLYEKKQLKGLIYVAPWVFGLLCFQFYPFLASLFYSFCNYNVMASPTWVGLKNYVRLFTSDVDFKHSLLVTAKYTVLTVPGKLTMSLLVAMFLNREIKGINLIRTVYYIPSLFGGSVAVAILWKLMFMDDGLINSFLSVFHVPMIQWLGNPKIALYTICMLEIWQFGSSMVMFLAALKQVPRSLYEAAIIDGAGKWTCFAHITFPQISPIIFFNLIMQTINALQAYTAAAVITNGGPIKSTYLVGIKLYKEAFQNYNMGYACAISWVIFLIIMVVTLCLFRFSSGWVYYEDGSKF